MQIGLLGKANVGKSTFFSAATQTKVATGNFPFTTIDPNVGVAHVRKPCACTHFELEECQSLQKTEQKKITLSRTENKFLDANPNARQADALVHVVWIYPVAYGWPIDHCPNPVPLGSTIRVLKAY